MPNPAAATPFDDPRLKKRYYDEPTTTRRVVMGLMRLLLPLIMEMRFEGTEHVPLQGACVLASNHLTNFDVFPLQLSVPRPIFFMGKEQLFRNPFSDALLRRLGGFPVYRGQRDQWAMDYAFGLLQRGRMVGMFPEGRRSHGQGLRPGKSGVARLALQAKCPIVPIGIAGTDYVFKRFPRRAPVVIRIGTPIMPLPDEEPLELTDRLMSAIAALLPARLRGVYA